ncbi:unnamed protein product [Rhodiola kirilowii]
MAEQIKELKDMMQHVIRRQPIQTKPCGFCAATDHKTDEPRPVRQYGAATTNQGVNGQPWKSNNQQHQAQREPARQGAPQKNQQNQQPYRHPHHQYQQKVSRQYQQRGPNNNQPGRSNHGSNKPLEEIVRDLAAAMNQDWAKTKGDIADLKKQVSQLATTVSDLANNLNAGRLPSQTIQNPRQNVSMIMIKDEEEMKAEEKEEENEKEQNLESASVSYADAFTIKARTSEELLLNQETSAEEKLETCAEIPVSNFQILNSNPLAQLPFPMQVVAPEGHMTEKAEPETRLVARHAQNNPMMRHPPTTSHETPPGKSNDPGAFTVTCGIGETKIHHCLIDLGAAINVMPYSLYCSLGLGPLKPPRLSIELGDKSCVRPTGLLEDLTLRVGDLAIPADFYVLQMGRTRNDEPPGLILGRSFLHTTKTKIDMGIGLLSLAFGGKESDFYVYEDANRPCTRKPPDIVHTSDYHTLVPDPPEQTIQTTGPAAMAKKSSPPRRNVKANPPNQWSADPSTSLHGNF